MENLALQASLSVFREVPDRFGVFVLSCNKKIKKAGAQEMKSRRGGNQNKAVWSA